jgi:hypothetical protein
MVFELLIPDESHTAIGALELDGLVQFGHRDNIESKVNWLKNHDKTYSFRA